MSRGSSGAGKQGFERLEDVRVYVLAESIADRIWDEVIRWEYFARDTVGKQLVRAAGSISANIAESYGRYHPRDVVDFLYHARGSLYETKSWLVKAKRRGLSKPEICEDLIQDVDNLAPQLNAYINSKRKRIRD